MTRLRQLFGDKLRAAGTWLGTPIGFVGFYLLADWFFSTERGAIVGLIGGSLALLGLVLAVAGFFYIVRD